MFTDVPDAPIYLRSTKIGSDYAILEWKPPIHDGGSKITQYTLKKRESPTDVATDVLSVSGREHVATVRGLKQNINYYFSVVAENKIGSSKPCEADDAVTLSKPLGMYCS